MAKERMVLLPVNTPIFPQTKDTYKVESVDILNDLDIAFKGGYDGKLFCVCPVDSKVTYSYVKQHAGAEFNSVGTVCDAHISKDFRTIELTGLYCATFEDDVDDADNSFGTACVALTNQVFYEEIDMEMQKQYESILDENVKKLSKEGPVYKHIENPYVSSKTLDEKINVILSMLSSQKVDAIKELKEENRLTYACVAVKEAINNVDVIKNIEKVVEQRLQNGQKEFFLREQLKAINQELGNENQEYNKLKAQIDDLKASEEVKEKLNYDLNRWNSMPTVAPEYSILRDYLDLAISLPWGIYSEDNYDLKNIREVLDKDHYGIEKVKERILEYIAVKKIAPDLNAPILCLVGAPGVGKTSIAQSIAKAIGKEYIHLSLGGINDEAEIRGHRRTYVGAMPGRIISELRKAKTSNPMFLLDEIDKIGLDKRKDPSGALLEILDPSQNNIFRDNYLDLPFDLSKVMFIMTANTLSTIQKPLLDRMEIIEMDSYTIEEKVEIAYRHLIPKQILNHGLDKYQVSIDKSCISDIVEGYTAEAGVRELERQIAKVCRKIATKIVGEDQKEFVINSSNLSEYLGTKKYSNSVDDVLGRVGVVNGLAWTSIGGTLLNIEAKLIPGGKGDIILTGKLGEVMQESAKIALSIVKSNLEKLNLPTDLLTKNDIHIHAPEGAVPKDGPSAGITLSTAILSAVTNIKVADMLAMTGEVTLTGKVLAIGGLKEKLLAAIRNGIKRVIVPKQNEKDFLDMPKTITEKLEIIYVEEINQVFEIALGVKL